MTINLNLTISNYCIIRLYTIKYRLSTCTAIVFYLEIVFSIGSYYSSSILPINIHKIVNEILEDLAIISL